MCKSNKSTKTNSLPIEVEIVKSPKKEKDTSSFLISLLALALSALTVWYNYNYNYKAGNAIAFKPYGLGIVRGIKESGHPSDHLVIPINWENNGAQSVIVGNVKIIVRPKLSNNKNEVIAFPLAGEYSEISASAFEHHNQYYRFLNSFVLPPHSKSSQNLVFHIDKWWDRKNKNYNYRFHSKDTYEFSISYDIDYSEYKNTENFKFSYTMPDRVDELNSSNIFYDYFSL